MSVGAQGLPTAVQYIRSRINFDGPNTINNHWCSAWWMMVILEVKPHVAIGVGVFAAFMSESMIQASARSHLRHKATSLQSELNIAIGQITDMKRALDITTKDLRDALDELHRRDAIGSPAARELLARQEEAMEAQKTALEVSTDRSFETLSRLKE